MRTRPTPLSRLALISLTLATTLGSCAGVSPDEADGLTAPEVLVSPYDSTRGEPLWAVAPVRNESGTSVVDVMAVSDALVARVQEIRGVSAVPMNRVLGAMRALSMREVRTPADARQLATTLGVDGILVGTVTAYDPYDPPTLGLTLGLFGRGNTMTPAPVQLEEPTAGIDPKTLASSAVERAPSRFTDRPLSVVVDHFDAKNHEVLMNVRRYAAGRSNADSALGWRGYLASVDRFTEFAAYQSLSDLLNKERLRMAQLSTGRTKPSVGNPPFDRTRPTSNEISH